MATAMDNNLRQNNNNIMRITRQHNDIIPLLRTI